VAGKLGVWRWLLPEVVAPFGAYFVRGRCVCHDLDRSHAEFKPDETKNKKVIAVN